MGELNEVSKVVRLTLIRIGIKCDLIGFSYLSVAIEMVVEEPMLVYNLNKLFEKVAKVCNAKSAFRVEANIQNAISFTYNQKGFNSVNDLFGMEVFKSGHKPTTAEIIKLVSEYYLMGLYKRNGCGLF
ncbi:MAG: hypothetical protein J6J24_04255 [Clostridia bacterium]|nr:hypothetical protein [Clostridia bacterium]